MSEQLEHEHDVCGKCFADQQEQLEILRSAKEMLEQAKGLLNAINPSDVAKVSPLLKMMGIGR